MLKRNSSKLPKTLCLFSPYFLVPTAAADEQQLQQQRLRFRQRWYLDAPLRRLRKQVRFNRSDQVYTRKS